MKIKKQGYSILVWALLAFCVFVRMSQVHAALGESVNSVESDRLALGAKRNASRATSLYSVEEFVTGSATIREYVSPAGTVFGVAWSGRRPPDFNALFGAYVTEYAQTKSRSSRTKGRQPKRLIGDRLVVETWGHMRKLQGHAFVPSLMPEGVSAHEIQ